MKIKFLLTLFILLCLACSCSVRQSSHVSEALDTDSIRYATGFTIKHYYGYTSAEVHDPWDSTRILQRYLLVDRSQPLPDNMPKGTIVRTPIRKIAVYTTVHSSIIDQLGETDKIVGICEPHYIKTESVQTLLRSGQIADLGEATSPNVERMIEIGAEIIIASPFQNNGYGQAEKLGIPIIEGADYTEPTPLGRAEWGRFYGLLLGKREVADSIFRETESRYLALKELAASAVNRPTVLTDKRYGSTWFVSSGESYVAEFFRDANVEYIFSDLKGTASLPMSFETVFERAIDADFWLIRYNQPTNMTYADLRSEYNPYENFKAFKQRNVYSCNTGNVPYYEEFPINPDYLLQDLIKIFHPELLPGSELRYYHKMP